MSINEARNLLGLPDDALGAKLRVPVNMVFFDKVDQIRTLEPPRGALMGR